MPVDYLTEEQEQRYGRYVGEPSPEQLARYFHLDDEDRLLIAQRRGDHNRLGFALQIGTLRFLGTFLADPVNVPVGVIVYLASQLSIADPQCIVGYAERVQTQQDRAQEIRQHFGYKEFADRCGGFALMRFLYARIWVGTERPNVIFDLATAWLLDKKVLLPGVTTLTRLISTVRERVAERLWQRLSATVSPEQRTDLEGLLARTGVSRITNLERLRRAPSRASAPVLVQALARLTEMRQLDVGPLDLVNIPASRGPRSGAVRRHNQSPKHCSFDRTTSHGHARVLCTPAYRYRSRRFARCAGYAHPGSAGTFCKLWKKSSLADAA